MFSLLSAQDLSMELDVGAKAMSAAKQATMDVSNAAVAQIAAVNRKVLDAVQDINSADQAAADGVAKSLTQAVEKLDGEMSRQSDGR